MTILLQVWILLDQSSCPCVLQACSTQAVEVNTRCGVRCIPFETMNTSFKSAREARYFLTIYSQYGQRDFTFIGQFGGINSVQNIITKQPGLHKMMQNIYQQVNLLNKGEIFAELAELSMVDYRFFT